MNSTITYYPVRYYNLEVTAAGEKVQKFYFDGGVTILRVSFASLTPLGVLREPCGQ